MIESARHYADEIIVIDDGSSDNTYHSALKTGVKVLKQSHKGYIEALKRGFQESQNDIIVTIDADGEHPASFIPILVEPVMTDRADLVIGSRERFARSSEYLLTWLTRIKIKIKDPCTGFRALNRQLAIKLKLGGYCTCGIFVLEALSLDARITEVDIKTNTIKKKRKIAWGHLCQLFIICLWLYKLLIKGQPRTTAI